MPKSITFTAQHRTIFGIDAPLAPPISGTHWRSGEDIDFRSAGWRFESGGQDDSGQHRRAIG
jgi:hypothetical protein